MQIFLPILAVVAGGVAIAIQAPLNAALARNLGATLPAATVSFAVGLILLVILCFATGTAHLLARVPQVPYWQLAGGLLGAYYVWSVAWGVPSLGVVSTAAALILGQMVAGIYFDSIGAFGLAVQAVSAKRLIAAGLVAAGLVMSRL